MHELPKFLFSVPEAAKMLNSSKATIYAAIHNGEINITKMGDKSQIHIDEIHRIAREGLGSRKKHPTEIEQRGAA